MQGLGGMAGSCRPSAAIESSSPLRRSHIATTLTVVSRSPGSGDDRAGPSGPLGRLDRTAYPKGVFLLSLIKYGVLLREMAQTRPLQKVGVVSTTKPGVEHGRETILKGTFFFNALARNETNFEL